MYERAEHVVNQWSENKKNIEMLLRCEKAAYTFPLKWNFFDDNWKWNKNIKKIDQLSRGSSWTLPLNSNHTFWSFSSSISFSCKFSTKKYGFYQNISKIDDEGVVEVERVDRERVKKFIKFPSLPSSLFLCKKKVENDISFQLV